MKLIHLIFFISVLSTLPVKASELLAPKTRMKDENVTLLQREIDLPGVTTTAFFRDYLSLYEQGFSRALEKALKGNLLGKGREDNIIRIHSAGSSDFSEPYSIAMFCFDHYEKYPEKWGELSPKNIIHIIASEIHKEAVLIGEQGLYSRRKLKRDFRTNGLHLSLVDLDLESFKERYFEPIEEGEVWQVKEKYKSLVHSDGRFDLINMEHPENMDIIFFNSVWSKFMNEGDYESMFEKIVKSFDPVKGGQILTNNLMLPGFEPEDGVLIIRWEDEVYSLLEYRAFIHPGETRKVPNSCKRAA